MAQKTEEGRLPPPFKKIKIPLSISGSPKEWAQGISECGFSLIESKKSSLLAAKIGSYSLSQRPHDYISILLEKGLITVSFSSHAGQNPSLRELEASSLALLTLGALGGASLSGEFCSYLCNRLESACGLISPSMASLEHENSKMKKSIDELEGRMASLYSQKEQDARRAIEAAGKIASLERRIGELEKIPDGTLDEIVVSWLGAHDGEIAPAEFCAHSNIPPARLEASLERLCRASRIRRI